MRIHRRIAVRPCLLAGLWLAGVSLPAKPNILLILSDDHSPPHVGCYGGKDVITPNLDAFAAQGMMFTRAYTTAPQCSPSRESIFAGRSPVGMGTTRFTQPVPKEIPFFTDSLRANGYWAGLDGRHHHLSGQNGGDPVVSAALEAAGLIYLDQRFDYHRIIGTGGAGLEKVGEKIEETLNRVPAGKPFFLYFGFNQPHYGWTESTKGAYFDPAKLTLPPDYPDLPEYRAAYARFLNAVHDLDRGFGMVMEVLKRRGLVENTIVVFMGDNGEALLRGKGTLYERGTHVPLIVRWPGVVKPGSISDVLVSGEDLAATLLGAAGVAVPSSMTSVSFLPALKGDKSFTGRQYVFCERSWHAAKPITRTDGFDLSRSITSRRFRYIYNVLPERTYTPVDLSQDAAWGALVVKHVQGGLSALHDRLLFQCPRPVFQLFDLEKDPYEMTNLAGQPEYAAIERTMREDLTRWMVRESDFVPPPTMLVGADWPIGEKVRKSGSKP